MSTKCENHNGDIDDNDDDGAILELTASAGDGIKDGKASTRKGKGTSKKKKKPTAVTKKKKKKDQTGVSSFQQSATSSQGGSIEGLRSIESDLVVKQKAMNTSATRGSSSPLEASPSTKKKKMKKKSNPTTKQKTAKSNKPQQPHQGLQSIECDLIMKQEAVTTATNSPDRGRPALPTMKRKNVKGDANDDELALQMTSYIRQRTNDILELTRSNSDQGCSIDSVDGDDASVSKNESAIGNDVDDGLLKQQHQKQEIPGATTLTSSVSMPGAYAMNGTTTTTSSSPTPTTETFENDNLQTSLQEQQHDQGQQQRDLEAGRIAPGAATDGNSATSSLGNSHHSLDGVGIGILTTEEDDNHEDHGDNGDGVVRAKAISREALIQEVRDEVLGNVVHATSVDVVPEDSSDKQYERSTRTSSGGGNGNDEYSASEQELQSQSQQDRDNDGDQLKKWKFYTFTIIGLGVCSFFMLGFIIFGLVFGLSNNDGDTDTNGNDATAPPSIGSETSAPTTNNTSTSTGGNPFGERFYSILDNEYGDLGATTKETILSGVDSPQKRAFDHLQNDPEVLNYPPSRLVRRYALISVYHALDGGNWVNKDGWLSYDTPECLWHGIVCDSDGETRSNNDGGGGGKNSKPIVSLDLSSNNLGGRIPPDFTYLTMRDLVSLDLSSNRIRGAKLDQLLKNSPKLEYLSLSDNEIPNDLNKVKCNTRDSGGNGGGGTAIDCSPLLQELHLSYNRFVGSLPTSFEELSSLRKLDVSSNLQLEGTVPSTYCNLAFLENLNIMDTSIEGRMPDCLCSRSSSDGGAIFMGSAECKVNGFTCACCDCCGCG